MKICIVCSGNICRSPFVERVLRRELGALHQVCSAGTLGIEGAGAYEVCTTLAPAYGLELNSHRSQALTRELVASCDLLAGLTREHCEAIRRCGAPPERVLLLGDFLPAGRVFDGGRFGPIRRGDDLPDPMGRSADVVRPILALLEIAALEWARELLEQGD
ncbi:MAG: hypothetical protein ACAI44_12415 [Candidatus Sericytochromatia bacterium]